jgi:hypothetical protein
MENQKIRLAGKAAMLMRISVLGLAVQVAVGPCAIAQVTQAQAAGTQLPPLMERQKEITLALSACPMAVASKAAVYILEKPG